MIRHLITTHEIPISLFTNGLYPLPAAWNPPANNPYGSANYSMFVESIDSEGNSSAPNPVATNRVGMVRMQFCDGRAQLKENLIFQFRAAPTASSFSFYSPANYGSGIPYEINNVYEYPTNYACAGLYPFTGPEYYAERDRLIGVGYGGNYGGIDIFLPFKENCQFRNFVFNLSDLNGTGNLTTGAGHSDIGSSDFLLLSPPTYLFDTNATTLPNLLSAGASQWTMTSSQDGGVSSYPGSTLLYYQFDLQTGYREFMSEGYSNWFGLPYISTELAYGNTAGTTATLYPGGSPVSGTDWNAAGSYLATAQPRFKTEKYCFYQPHYDWLPGSPYFSPTNDSPLLMVWTGSGYTATNDLPYAIVPAGSWAQLAGYAKLAVTNVNPLAYGYLGQYFEAAYEVDSAGHVTTNMAGVISPYGDYFGTTGGQAALVTMPDLDTGEQGTCMVFSVSLQLDKNHDGKMDLSLNSPDATSTNSPFVLWCNNNFDRNVLDANDNELYDDDVLNTSQAAGCYFTPNTPTPDCNFLDGAGQRTIPNARDLEDFARLWVSGITSNLLAVLPAGSTITLTLTNVNGQTPTIDLFAAADADGGIAYLTNQMTSLVQTIEPYIGRLGVGQSVQLNSSAFGNNWAGNHFIWCGVSNGTGGLNLTIKDGGGKVLAQSTSYIQIMDIKQMYERWTVGDDPAKSPTNFAALATEELPVGTPAFQYALPTSTNAPYILFVHGWNMDRYDKDRFAETAFKRLYWQGYQGRFGAFRWPTDYGFFGTKTQIAANPTEKDNYDRSEYNAWQSAQGLLNTLTNLNGEYPGHVYMLAHSMGNIVASEALRLAGPQGFGRIVNTYVASQAAISAHTYDDDTNDVPNYSFHYPPWSASAATPNIYGDWFAQNNGAGAGQVISFYNRNDFALQRSAWQLNQLFKPDQSVMEGRLKWSYRYLGIANDPAPWNNFTKENDDFHLTVNFDIVNVLTNRYEVMGYAAQSWTTALGATPGVGNVKRNVDLTSQDNGLWSTDPTGGNWTEHFWHSAEFRGDYCQQQGYWRGLLGSYGFNLK